MITLCSPSPPSLNFVKWIKWINFPFIEIKNLREYITDIRENTSTRYSFPELIKLPFPSHVIAVHSTTELPLMWGSGPPMSSPYSVRTIQTSKREKVRIHESTSYRSLSRYRLTVTRLILSIRTKQLTRGWDNRTHVLSVYIFYPLCNTVWQPL